MGRNKVIQWDEAEFIQALYQGLLRRTPSPSEVQHHAKKFTGKNVAAAGNLLASFANSQELVDRLSEKALARAVLSQSDLAAREALVLSLGTHCYAASMMKRWNLKKFSGPLDWIFSSPEMAAHCITDGFRTLLDRSHYFMEPDRRNERYPGGHRFYLDQFQVTDVFNHHNPVWDDEYAYLRRCVDRFAKVLAHPAHKVFLCVVRGDHRQADGARILARVIGSVTTSAELIFVAARPKADIPCPRVDLVEKGEGLRFLVMTPVSTLGATDFGRSIDEVCLVTSIMSDFTITALDLGRA